MARRGRMQTVRPWQLEELASSAFSLVSSAVFSKRYRTSEFIQSRVITNFVTLADSSTPALGPCNVRITLCVLQPHPAAAEQSTARADHDVGTFEVPQLVQI